MISPALFIGALLLEGALFAAWLWAERRERQQLLDRLMARSLTEYTLNQARTPAPQSTVGQDRRHNVIANYQARQRGEAATKPASRANPLLAQEQNDD